MAEKVAGVSFADVSEVLFSCEADGSVGFIQECSHRCDDPENGTDSAACVS